MKKISLILTALLVSALVLVGCGKADAPKTLKVGATAVPHAEILQIVKPILAKENVNLEISDLKKSNGTVIPATKNHSSS